MKKHFKATFNPRFTTVKQIKEGKKLSQEDIAYLLDNMHNLDLWMEYMPPENFEFQGFVVMHLSDVTTPEVISSLKQKLLEKGSIVEEEKFTLLQEELRTLFNVPDLRLGVAGFQQHRGGFANFGQQKSNSFILENTSGSCCPVQTGGVYKSVVMNQQVEIIRDIAAMDAPTDFEKGLLNHGIHNVLIAPLHFDQKMIGILELVSEQADALNSASLIKIEEILPLFSIAVSRSTEEMNNNVQSIIKEECTAIHPTVEWKFVQAAQQLLDKQVMGSEATEMAPIVFENVFPLYGASDVRSSSHKRNIAIQEDLIEHLTLAKRVMRKALAANPLPIYDEICFKINRHIHNIRQGLNSGDEVGILDFLKRDVEPLFDHLSGRHPSVADAVVDYQNAIDPKLGVLYNKRKDFEDSLTKINETVSALLDKRQAEAQAMFPHYFEKYKTDGVEYNIYVGASLIPNHADFDPIYLRNLRLWQLITTCEVAQRTAAVIPKLKIPLETTHLLLVHSAPLAIRFRTEEKHFDVDGAYNIRYEIIKKRIDKAYIRDTEERLTQPRKIAIVYSHPKEAHEYREYLEYLQGKGYLEGEIEDVELEKLQGVQGLRALRVTVKMPEKQTAASRQTQEEAALGEMVVG